MNPGTNISITGTGKNGVLKSKRKTSIQVNSCASVKFFTLQSSYISCWPVMIHLRQTNSPKGVCYNIKASYFRDKFHVANERQRSVKKDQGSIQSRHRWEQCDQPSFSTLLAFVDSMQCPVVPCSKPFMTECRPTKPFSKEKREIRFRELQLIGNLSWAFPFLRFYLRVQDQ